MSSVLTNIHNLILHVN